ncbi:MAG: hydroxyacylglutathione hydrolase [Dehalococcoidia bacterium]|nr:hydroxyacylglutathione hydrolase [Dehalococcoidia bacterium]
MIIPTLSDNYTYLIENGSEAVVVDPGEARPVLRRLERTGASLVAVVCTHGHFDHTAGNEELVRETDCLLYLPRDLSDGDAASTDMELSARSYGPFKMILIPTPGHSKDSVCYYLAPAEDAPGAVFTGDTLFVGGCGRLFTHSPSVMWQSLQRLLTLPPETLVYCGHDYALENYEFALDIEPDNGAVKRRLEEMRAVADVSGNSVPSTMEIERATNPFLRAAEPEMKRVLGMPDASDAEVFAELRRRKDRF